MVGLHSLQEALFSESLPSNYYIGGSTESPPSDYYIGGSTCIITSMYRVVGLNVYYVDV